MSEAIQQLVGTVLDDKYLLQSILGVGGMGAVFKGVQLTVDRPVAVKILRPNSLVNADTTVAKQLRDRFKREATLTAMLRHPNNIHLVDFGATADGTLYLVLEFLEGQELSKAMAEANGPMDPLRVAAIGHHICLALAEAHTHELIHRDLKPDNIFLTKYHGANEHVKVMDYGIARIASDEEQNLTATGLIIGTPKYMSPEQVEAKPLTPQSDLYSLGVLLYEMLMGHPPFQAESMMSLAFKHVHDTPPPLDTRYGDDWILLLDMLLAKDPRQRPESAALVANRLQAMSIDSAAALTILPTSLPTHGIQTPATQRPVGLIAAVAVLAVLAIGGVIALVSSGDNPASEGATPVAANTEKVDKTASPPTPPAGDRGDTDSPSDAAVEQASERPAAPDTSSEAPSKAAPAELVKPEPTPPKPTALSLRTTPTGATVLRQDKVLCTTPCIAETLEGLGETALVVRLEGHKERTITVPLKPGSLVDRELVLTALPTPPSPAPTVPAADAVEPTAEVPPSPVAKKKKKRTKKKRTKFNPVFEPGR